VEEERACCRLPEEAKAGGFWQRLKSFFGLGTKPESPSDPQALRGRGEELRKRLQDGVAADGPARLAALRATSNDLTALVRDLLAAGEQSDLVMRLAALVADLPKLLQKSPPADDEVTHTWEGIVAALRAWLGLPPADDVGGGREGFWK
jgi:hypothetical protein